MVPKVFPLVCKNSSESSGPVGPNSPLSGKRPGNGASLLPVPPQFYFLSLSLSSFACPPFLPFDSPLPLVPVYVSSGLLCCPLISWFDFVSLNVLLLNYWALLLVPPLALFSSFLFYWALLLPPPCGRLSYLWALFLLRCRRGSCCGLLCFHRWLCLWFDHQRLSFILCSRRPWSSLNGSVERVGHFQGLGLIAGSPQLRADKPGTVDGEAAGHHQVLDPEKEPTQLTPEISNHRGLTCRNRSGTGDPGLPFSLSLNRGCGAKGINASSLSPGAEEHTYSAERERG